MRDDLRISGIDIIGDVPWGTHLCQFYKTKQDLLDIVIPYFKAGLENNELCLWIIPESLNAKEAKEALRRDIPDIDVYLEKGQIELIPYADWYLIEGNLESQNILDSWVEKLNQALTNDYEGLRITEYTCWLEKEGCNDFVDYKERLNSFINKNQIIDLCTYSLDTYSAADILEIAANHEVYLIKKKGKWKRIDNSGRKNSIELKKAEEELENLHGETQIAESRLEAVLNHLPVGVIIADAPSGKLLIGNEWVKKIFRGNLPLSSSVEEYGEYIGFHPDGRQYKEEEWPLARAVRNGEEVIGEEIEFQLADGTRRIISVSAAPIKDEKDRIINAVVVDEDITEIKRAQKQLERERARLQTIIENIPVAVGETDASGGVLLDNGILESIWKGASKINSMSDYKEFKAWWPETGERVKPEEWPAARALKGEASTATFDIEKFDGTRGAIIVSANPIIGESGEVNSTIWINQDITELKQAEEALRKAYEKLQIQSEELYASNEELQAQTEELQDTYQALSESEKCYHMLFTNMTEAFLLAEVIYNENGKPCDYRFLEINPAYELNMDIKREQILGKSVLEVFPKASDIAIENSCEVALSGEPMHFENFSPTTGKYFEVYAFCPEKGKFAAIFRDITERKEAEAALRESQSRLETVFSAIPDAIIEYDINGKPVRANEAAIKAYGLRPPDLTRDKAVDKLKIAHMDNSSVKVEELPTSRALKGEITAGELYQFTDAEGKELIITTYAAPLFKDEKVIGAVALWHDITGLKRAEGALKKARDTLEEKVKERTAELEKAYNSLQESERSLAEAQKMAHLGNWEWDIATDKAYWSDEVYRIFGLSPQEFRITFDTYFTYVHPDDRDDIINAIKEAFKGKPYSIDNRIITANGEERIVHTDAETIFNEDNVPVYARGIVQDITERRKAEEALAKIDEIRIKEIHHRIKNNLQVISSLLDLQAEAFSNLETCKTPDVIEAFMESQNRVISMALIHEELYKGDKIDTLDFAAYLRKLASDLFSSYNLGNKNINFNLNLEQVDVDMDTAIPLGIIVNELVSNSFKHAFPAGRDGEIQINLHKNKNFGSVDDVSELGNNCIEKRDFDYILKISDNGKGIPKEIDLQTVESLGLQLVNILVDQIDGCVELKRDNGTKFLIWFNDMQR